MDMDNMKADFESGMRYVDLAKKYHVSTATISNYKQQFLWQRSKGNSTKPHINNRYKLIYSEATYKDEDDHVHYKRFARQVIIPSYTMERLQDDKVYPFYKFIQGDGQELFIRFNNIAYIEKCVGND